ncbi:MAG: recombinase [uncultured bacterium]|nr:MAG: recombinase [uncultured bacterium]
MRYTDEEKEKLKAICPKCVGYCRISTQNQKDEGLSIDVQQTKIYEKVRELKGELIGIFTDEAKTGTNLNRPGLTALLARCTKGDIDYLIVQDTSRLSRDTKDYLGVKALLKKEKVDIVALSGMQSQGDDPYSQFLDEIIAAVNALHPRVSGYKARQTAMEKFKAGYYPSWAPIGYKNIKNPNPSGPYDKRIIIPDELTRQFISQAFKMYATRDFSIYDIRQYLHKSGVRGRKGRPLQYSVVHHMLRNSFYWGWMKHGGLEGMGKHDKLIDKPTFDIVQQILTDKGEYGIRHRKHNFLLRGIVFCKECGRRFVAEYHYNQKYKTGGGKIGMYHCSQTGKRGKCHARSLSLTNLEDQVQQEVNKLAFKPEFIEAVKNQIQNVYQETIDRVKLARKSANNRKDAIEMKRDRIELDYCATKLTVEQYQRFNAKLDAEMLNVQKELSDIDKMKTIDVAVVNEVLELTRNIAQSYARVDTDHKRAYLHFFFKKLWVKDRKIVEVEYTPAIQVLQDTHLVILSANWLPRVDSNHEP